LDHLGPFGTILDQFYISTIFLFRIFYGHFDISGSMIPCLVPEISPLDAFCDRVGVVGKGVVVVGIGDSRSWIDWLTHRKVC